MYVYIVRDHKKNLYVCFATRKLAEEFCNGDDFYTITEMPVHYITPKMELMSWVNVTAHAVIIPSLMGIL